MMYFLSFSVQVCLSSMNCLVNSSPEVAPTLVESVSSLLPTSSGLCSISLQYFPNSLHKNERAIVRVKSCRSSNPYNI